MTVSIRVFHDVGILYVRQGGVRGGRLCDGVVVFRGDGVVVVVVVEVIENNIYMELVKKMRDRSTQAN